MMSGSDAGLGLGLDATPDAGREVFVLTDEQIIGLDAGGGRDAGNDEASVAGDPRKSRSFGRDDGKASVGRNVGGAGGESLTPEGVSYRDAQPGKTVPPWLAERMKDPWHGDEARELWEGVQRAEKDAAAYRAAFATPEDARALKELYPGGVSEAKAAADGARQLAEIDGAYFRGDAAARGQLARRMMEQDPGAFREMVEAGVRLLEAAGVESGPKTKTRARIESQDNREEKSGGGQDAAIAPRSLHSDAQKARVSGRDDNKRLDGAGGESLTPEGVSYRRAAGREIDERTAGAYASFEKAANLELERSVGVTIERTLEQALPNLGRMDRTGQDATQRGASLQQRLGTAVRDEIDVALKSDAQLGEQIAKVLAGRCFDDGARAQVVRLIDARAQQLVPGAVRRVVGSWTQTTLGTRRGSGEGNSRGDRVEKIAVVASGERGARSSEKAASVRESGSRGKSSRSDGRVDYGKLSDEQILEL